MKKIEKKIMKIKKVIKVDLLINLIFGEINKISKLMIDLRIILERN